MDQTRWPNNLDTFYVLDLLYINIYHFDVFLLIYIYIDYVVYLD